MIGLILELLKLDDFYGESIFIDIAKGRNQLQTTLEGKRKQAKRLKEWQSKKR